MPGKSQSKRDKPSLDLRASVELIGVHPIAAGRSATPVKVSRPKGKPSLTASVHMPAPGRRPLNLIREPTPGPAESAPLPPQKPDQAASSLGSESSKKPELFWDSLLSRPFANASTQGRQPHSPSVDSSEASKDKAVRTHERRTANRPEKERNLLVEALSPGLSAKPPSRPSVQRRSHIPQPPAQAAPAPMPRPALNPNPIARRRRRAAKKKPAHRRIWELAETVLLDGRVTTGAAVTFAFLTGIALFNSIEFGPRLLPARPGPVSTGELDPLSRIPISGSSIVNDPGSWLERLLRPLERRASKYIVDQFSDGVSDWTDSSPLQILRQGMRVTSGLALRKSTLELDDYRFEFEAKSETGAIGWVVRAADEFDHYAFKFDAENQLKRYAVIGGQSQKETIIDAPAGLLSAAGFNRILVQVKGERMMTMVNGLGVDLWKDTRIQRGGVGFIAGNGESALVRRMVLVANDDALGMVINGAIETIRSFADEPENSAAGPMIQSGPVAFLVVTTPYPGPSIRPYGFILRP